MAPKKEKAPPPSSKPAKSGGGKQKKKRESRRLVPSALNFRCISSPSEDGGRQWRTEFASVAAGGWGGCGCFDGMEGEVRE